METDDEDVITVDARRGNRQKGEPPKERPGPRTNGRPEK